MSTPSIDNPDFARFHDFTRTDGSMIPGIPVPCPFCGNSDAIGVTKIENDEKELPSYCAMCEACYTRGPTGDTHLGAAVAWNKREAVNANRRQIDRVVEARLADIVWRLWQAHGVVHGVQDALRTEHCDIGNSRSETLGAALSGAAEALERIADRLDTENLCDKSRRVSVYTTDVEEVAA